MGIRSPTTSWGRATTTSSLETEYHTYDVTSLLTSGSNTLGVQVGNGMELRSRSATNSVTGRTSPYAYNVSAATGSGTLVAPAAIGDTRVRPSSTSNFSVGRTINVDTGNGGDNLESRTITGVFPAASTTLVVPAAAGDTNVKVASVNNIGVGTTLNIDTGANLETVTTTAVGTGAGSTTLVAPAASGDTNVKVASVSGFAPGGTINVDAGGNLETATISSVGTAAGAATTTFAAATAGDTNVKVSSISGFAVGEQMSVDTGANLETVTVTAVGTQGRRPPWPPPPPPWPSPPPRCWRADHRRRLRHPVADNTGFTAGHDDRHRHGRQRRERDQVASTATTGIVVPLYPATPTRRSPTGSGAPRPAPAAPRPDLPAQELHGRRPGPGDARAAAHQRRRLGLHLRQRHQLSGRPRTVTTAGATRTLVDIASCSCPATTSSPCGDQQPQRSGSAIGALRSTTSSGLTRYVSDTSWKALAGNPATGPAGWTTASRSTTPRGATPSSARLRRSPWDTTDTDRRPARPPTRSPSARPSPTRTPRVQSSARHHPAGVTNLKVASVTGFSAGQSITIDTGTSTETATISAVGTAGADRHRPHPVRTDDARPHRRGRRRTIVAPAGATNIKVASVTGFAVGDTMTIDTGAPLRR